MKNLNVENFSISSLNSSKNKDQISRHKKSHIQPHFTASEINLEDLNISVNKNEITYKNIPNFNKIKKLSNNLDNSTGENNSLPDSILKKKKLKRKMHNSTVKENINDTQFAMTSFKEKINESSISMNDEKDNNYIITNTDNSFIQMNNNSSTNNFNTHWSNYLPTEERLRNLVKQTKRSCNKILNPIINKTELEDCESGLISSNNYNAVISNDKDTFEIKNHSQYTNFELSKMLFEIIHSAPDSINIILPPRFISFPYLVINNNLRIKGCPGTLVEINNGLIIISSKSKQFLSISECSFVFNFEVKSFKEKYKNDEILKNNITLINDKYYISLFKILSDSDLNVNDCDFRSIVHEEEEVVEDNSEERIICETCFSLSSFNSHLTLQSTICSNFYKIIETVNCSNVTLDNCHFSDAISNAITLKNFRNFNFVQSTVSNCLNAIDIFFSDVKNISTQQSQLTTTDNNFKENINGYLKDELIKIKISDSEFNQNQNLAVGIRSENQFHNARIKLEIRKNIFKQNKIGITITKCFISSLDIIENEIKNNLEEGIQINNLNFISKKNNHDDSFTKLLTIENQNTNDNFLSDANIKITKNEIKENKNKIGLKIENCSNFKLQLEDNKIFNNLIGLYMSNIQSALVIMKKNSISENSEEGVNISNIAVTSKIFIYGCKIFKNISYGINLQNNTLSGITYPVVYVKNLDISNNKKGGICFINFALTIENTVITDNGQWAIELPFENNKQLLKLQNYDHKNLNSFINNAIGGSWGIIENKKSICSNGKCFIL